MLDNEVLERELGDLNLRINVYSAVLFHKTADQDTMRSWFEQRKRSSRSGFLRAVYKGRKGDAIIEMDVDGKQIYLIASTATSKAPLQMKQDIGKGEYGERHALAERIEVLCFPYECDTHTGFIQCEALAEFRKQHEEKREAKKELAPSSGASAASQ